MILKARYANQTFRDGDTRIKRIFAWLPFRINDDLVWLEKYEVLQLYKTISYPANDKAYTVNEWINLSYRIIV